MKQEHLADNFQPKEEARSVGNSPISSVPVIEAIPNAVSPTAIPLPESRTLPNGSDGLFLVEPKENRSAHGPITTDFCVLPDGSLVELVYGQDQAKSALRFLIWNAERVSIVDHFEHDGDLHVPPVLDQKLSGNLRLPGEVKTCPAPTEIFIEISQLIRSYVGPARGLDQPCSCIRSFLLVHR